MSDDWPAYDNGPLEEQSPNHLFVRGFLGRSRLGRNMSAVRLTDGRVVIHNAICLDEAGMARLEDLGELAFLLVPSAWHRADAARYKARYPQLVVLCPPGARGSVEKVVPVDGDYRDFPPDQRVQLEHWEGTGEAEGVVTVRDGDDAVLLTCDALFNLPHEGGLAGLIPRLLGSSGGPKVTPLGKRMIKDKAAFAGHLRRLAETPGLRRVLVQHREPIEGDVAATLRGVAAAL